MVASTIDHLVAVTIFIGALLLFVGMFNQTIQTAILFQQHSYLATKCSDLLDGMLLNPGYPTNWGQTDAIPSSLGLQDPEFTQYQSNAFTLMRMQSSNGTALTYSKSGLTYSNITAGFGNFLLVPYTEAINYTLAQRLLGLNSTFGFQLTMTPILTIAITENRINAPTSLNFTINTTGIGFPVSNATLNYYFLNLTQNGAATPPACKIINGTARTDYRGQTKLKIGNVSDSYALIVYAHMGGLSGIGYYEHITSNTNYPLPLVKSFTNQTVILAHSYDLHAYGSPAPVFFNATLMILTQDFRLRGIPMGASNGITGSINYGSGQPYTTLTIPTLSPGILVITYACSTGYGVILMPWGLSSMSFPLVFGGSPNNQEWVATDIRQIAVNGINYQAKLALWSLTGLRLVT
jgi:hypothetical protein